jgi:hypothetical protein
MIIFVKCKGKVHFCTGTEALYRPTRWSVGCTAHRGSRGIALPFLDHSTRRGWGVSVTPRPLLSPGTHCTRGWVGLRFGLVTIFVRYVRGQLYSITCHKGRNRKQMYNTTLSLTLVLNVFICLDIYISVHNNCVYYMWGPRTSPQ